MSRIRPERTWADNNKLWRGYRKMKKEVSTLIFPTVA
jgi:hypothetical protein